MGLTLAFDGLRLLALLVLRQLVDGVAQSLRHLLDQAAAVRLDRGLELARERDIDLVRLVKRRLVGSGWNEHRARKRVREGVRCHEQISRGLVVSCVLT